MDNSLLFIQETGNTPHARHTRSQIKMHVMDRLVTQRRTRLRSVAGVAITPKEDRREYSEGESGDGNFQSGESIQAGSVPESLSSTQDLINLAGLHIKMNKQTKFLLHHFLYHRSKSLCTVTVETGWLSYALKDPGLFHSTLYHWALLNGDMTPVSFRQTDQLLKVKQVAIHSINERLRNGEISDEVVASVTCLASVNFLLGDAHEAEMHFKGLHAMVASRAGLCQLGFDGLIARLVRWTDSCHAQVSSRQLVIEDSELRQPSQLIFQMRNFQLANSHIILRLRHISNELIERARSDLSIERRISLGEQFLISDRELLQLMHSDATPITVSITATSALIFSHTVLRGISRFSRLITRLLTHLKNSITVALTLPRSDRFSDPAVLVWALLIGVLASVKDSPDYVWFMKCLTQAGEYASIDWDQVNIVAESSNDHPAPFHWVLEDQVVLLKDVNTMIML